MISYDSPASNDFLVLAEFRDSKIVLNDNNLRALSSFNRGRIILVCFEQFLSKNYMIFRDRRSSSKRVDADNCLLIRPNPFAVPRTNRHIFYAYIKASNPAARETLHMLATSISDTVLVCSGPEQKVSYLGSVTSRITGIHSRQKGNMQLSKLSHLLGILPNKTDRSEFIRDSTEKLIAKLEQERILNQVLTSYASCKGLQCSQLSLIQPTPGFEESLTRQIDIVSMGPKQNTQLMYGPVLAQFIVNVTDQLNRGGQLNLERAEDDILIDGGYEAYRAGVEKYHQYGLKLIDRNAKPDNNQLQSMMRMAKSKAFEEFYTRQGSNSLQYRRMLEDYIENKNRQVVSTYSQQQWNKNLQILEVQSKSVLDKISASGTKDQNQIMSYISQMTKNYEENAKGPQKYEILNDYMKVFTPIAYEGDPEKQARLRQQLKRNQDLQKQMAELSKRKSGGCCSACQIM